MTPRALTLDEALVLAARARAALENYGDCPELATVLRVPLALAEEIMRRAREREKG
jgi:hypothetical protein